MRHHSTPQFAQEAPQISPVDPIVTTDPVTVREALAALDAVPHNELPPGGAREALALAQAIRAGVVDAIYRRRGTTTHLLTLAIVEPHEEPRRTLAAWCDAYAISRKWHSAAMAVWADDDRTGAQDGAEGGKA